MTTADQIKNKIADGDLEESLDLAINFLQGRDPGLYSECLQHKGRLNDHNRQYRLKIISVDTMDMTRAQVRSALLDVVILKIDALSGPGVSAFVPPFEPARQPQTVTLNFGHNATPPKGFFVPKTNSPASSLADHTAARQLIEDFVKLLATYEVENAAWRAAPFLHRSLLQGEMMQPQFKQNNFYSAHQRFRSYKIPISFVKTQATNRTAIGSLRDRDEGEEYVYTLEKNMDNGGMPGTVRVFFPNDGGGPKITLVSL
ncbi:MAG: hypothetical protein K9J37_14295 [Saprospiraceae bacterium]|nr:hypothetical protein [Saprospiraceae bacterium]MCF8251077.1 hypothetical protein [Saprospiraceae bacterium]MCF8280362.1 hypothetical protein [Bacteroidales bacterium]MCF8312867.1 hypothetical protein [Saprospiraceae bacterium]MCF8441336.1 hypothetical protein [Saprospiraceae bacterium]